MRFLHCSDLHLRYLQGTRLAELCNKRVTGALNLVLNRAKSHRDSRFDALLQAATALGVDHIFVSGDLINLGMRREFEACAQALAQSGCSFYVVPGNHDIYLTSGDPLGDFQACFKDYLGPSLLEDAPFPYKVEFDEMTLFGLNSSVGRPWFLADGHLGAPQLEVFERSLALTRAQGKRCVVMLHHPVTQGASRPRRDLQDRKALAQVLALHGADLVLHGHEHREYTGALPGPAGTPVVVHGVASATSLSSKFDKMAAFTVYEITDGAIRYQRFRCETPEEDTWTVNSPQTAWKTLDEDRQIAQDVLI